MAYIGSTGLHQSISGSVSMDLVYSTILQRIQNATWATDFNGVIHIKLENDKITFYNNDEAKVAYIANNGDFHYYRNGADTNMRQQIDDLTIALGGLSSQNAAQSGLELINGVWQLVDDSLTATELANLGIAGGSILTGISDVFTAGANMGNSSLSSTTQFQALMRISIILASLIETNTHDVGKLKHMFDITGLTPEYLIETNCVGTETSNLIYTGEGIIKANSNIWSQNVPENDYHLVNKKYVDNFINVWHANVDNAQYGNIRVYENEVKILTEPNIAEPRKYPPVGFDVNGGNVYEIDDTQTDYGIGTYELIWSSPSSTEPVRNADRLFDGITNDDGGEFYYGSYDINGTFINHCILKDYKDFDGDFVIIKMPQSIFLSSFKIWATTNKYNCRAKDYKLFGTNNGVYWTNLITATDAEYIENIHEYTVNYLEEPFHTFALSVNKTYGGHALTLAEIEIYGKETLTYTEDNFLTTKTFREEGYITSNAVHSIINSCNYITIDDITTNDLWVDNRDHITFGDMNVYYNKIAIKRNDQFPRQALTSGSTDIDVDGNTITVNVKSSSQYLERSPFQLFDRNTGVLGGNINISGWTCDWSDAGTSYPYKTNSTGAVYDAVENYYVKDDYKGEYVMIDMGEPVIIMQMRLWCNIDTSARGRHPRNYKLYATNEATDFDNVQSVNWTEIFDKIDTTPTSIPRSNPTIDNITNFESYRYYALVINSIYNRETDDLVELFEIELFQYSAEEVRMATVNDLSDYQPLLTAGDNITITENEDGTTTIAATDIGTTYTAGDNITITENEDGTTTIAATDTNTDTTYSAGTGMELVGTTFNCTVVNTDTDTTYSAGTGMSLDGTTFNCDVVNTDTTYSAGTGMSLDGTTFNCTVVNTDTTYTAGNNITISEANVIDTDLSSYDGNVVLNNNLNVNGDTSLKKTNINSAPITYSEALANIKSSLVQYFLYVEPTKVCEIIVHSGQEPIKYGYNTNFFVEKQFDLDIPKALLEYRYRKDPVNDAEGGINIITNFNRGEAPWSAFHSYCFGMSYFYNYIGEYYGYNNIFTAYWQGDVRLRVYVRNGYGRWDFKIKNWNGTQSATDEISLDATLYPFDFDKLYTIHVEHLTSTGNNPKTTIYVNGVIFHVKEWITQFQEQAVDSIYVGGGTNASAGADALSNDRFLFADAYAIFPLTKVSLVSLTTSTTLEDLKIHIQATETYPIDFPLTIHTNILALNEADLQVNGSLTTDMVYTQGLFIGNIDDGVYLDKEYLLSLNLQGLQGEKGDKGDKGDPGDPGAPGLSVQGPPGDSYFTEGGGVIDPHVSYGDIKIYEDRIEVSTTNGNVAFVKETDLSDYQPLLTAGDNISITKNDADGTTTIAATDTDTTYLAGTGMSLVGTTFNCTVVNTDTDTTYTAGTGMELVGTTFNCTVVNTDTDTTYSAGTGMSLDGTTFNCTVVNTDTTYTAGNNIEISDNGDGTFAIASTATGTGGGDSLWTEVGTGASKRAQYGFVNIYEDKIQIDTRVGGAPYIQPTISLNTAPIVDVSDLTNQITGTEDFYYIFEYSTTGASTSYDIRFTENTLCDIVVVGGGGAGGIGKGGGSAGGVVYYSDVSFVGNTNYNVEVGRGGISEGQDGIRSYIIGANVAVYAVGGLASSTIDGASGGTSITNTITAAGSTANINLVPKNGAAGLASGSSVQTSTLISTSYDDLSSSPVATDVVGNTEYKYYAFLQSGTIEFNEDIECDVLIVGGGGGGSGYNGAGGGGGGVLYATGVSIPANTYNITVGNGGQNHGDSGEDSVAFGATVKGGGGTSTEVWNAGTDITNSGKTGGSGGGGKSKITGTAGVGGTADLGTKGILLASGTSYGNNGGNGGIQTSDNNWRVASAGGGGAGAVGRDGPAGASVALAHGGNGIQINIDGNNYYWAGGGGGGGYLYTGGNGGLGGGGGGGAQRNNTEPITLDGETTTVNQTPSGGTGGGSAINSGLNGNGITGARSDSSRPNGGDGGANTGGGGGGSGAGGNANDFGKGGSGIVIIRVPTTVGPTTTGGGGGTNTDAPALTLSTDIPDGGDATMVNIYGDDLYLSGGGGGSSADDTIIGTQQGGGTYGYGGSSTSTSYTPGGDGLVIIKWNKRITTGSLQIIPTIGALTNDRVLLYNDVNGITSSVNISASKLNHIRNLTEDLSITLGNKQDTLTFTGDGVSQTGNTITISDTSVIYLEGTNISFEQDVVSGNTYINSTDTNTTYSAGTGLSLTGTTFACTVVNTDTTYSAGTGLSLTGTSFANTKPWETAANNSTSGNITSSTTTISGGVLTNYVNPYSTTGTPAVVVATNLIVYTGTAVSADTHSHYSYGPTVSGLTNSGNANITYSVRVLGGGLWSSASIKISSDERIKYDIRELDDMECLTKIRALKPCKYKYRDIEKQMGQTHQDTIGFISQEVKEVIPDAVDNKTREPEVIPNIQRTCEISSNILTINDAYEFVKYNTSNEPMTFVYDYEPVVSDIIEVRDGNDKYMVKIDNILSSNVFEVSYESEMPMTLILTSNYEPVNNLVITSNIVETSNIEEIYTPWGLTSNIVFGEEIVYSSNYEISSNLVLTSNYEVIMNDVVAFGTYIDDFHTLDKQAIYTVGIGAIQELDRQIIDLKTENEMLKNNLNMISGHLFGSNMY